MNQTDEWRGSFGDEYTARNAPSDEQVAQTALALADIWSRMTPAPRSILEVGSNVGRNIRALRAITTADIHAVEPNEAARKVLAAETGITAEDATANELPYPNGRFDCVFTSGVLIHIPDTNLRSTYEELHRVSGRWILSIEYFSPTTQIVQYRGHDDLLFKRDYGSLWLDWFDDLEHVGNGFFWRRTTGQDNANWWLFQKR